MKKIRLLYKHKKDCLAIKNVLNKTWDSPFVLAEHQYLGGRAYYIWHCNDPECKATLAIRDYIIDNLAYKLQRRTK